MRREIHQWVPSRWSEKRCARMLRRVYACAFIDLVYMLGPYNGAAVAAELKAQLQSELSKAELCLRGVKTLGDVSRPPEVT